MDVDIAKIIVHIVRVHILKGKEMNKKELIKIIQDKLDVRSYNEKSLYKMGLMKKFIEAKEKREDMEFCLHMINKLECQCQQ